MNYHEITISMTCLDWLCGYYQRCVQIQDRLSQLPKDELELIILVYYNHISLKTYAAKKGMSYYLAKKKRTEILEKLRK